MVAEEIITKNKFDFESGYITKSPCRDCAIKKNLPRCSNHCRKLNQLQNLLIDLISCSNNFTELETYSLPRQYL